MRFVEVSSRLGGIPKVAITDRDLQFAGDFDRACERNDIVRAKTTTYHPQSNGRTERVNLSIKIFLKKVVEKKHGWVDELGRI